MANYPAKAGNKNERITKMKKTKQILSLFLSVCMIISCMVGMSVTASAEEKPLAVGTIYNIGDAFVVSAGGAEIVIDDENNYTHNFAPGSYAVPQPMYSGYAHKWVFDIGIAGLFLGSGTIDGTENVTGIMCVSGDGTEENPYRFVLVFGSSTPATTTGGFVKVTDQSQITEDNIGESTEAEAKAWIKANLTTLQSECDNIFGDFFWKENGTLKEITLYDEVLNEVGVNSASVYGTDISVASMYFNFNENVYFWGASSTPSTPTPPTVAVSPEGAGTASVEEDPANSDNWLFTATPNEGYKFKWWALDHSNAPTGKYLTNTTSIVKTNFTESAGNNMITGITAVFEVSTYNISFDNGGTAKVDGTVVTSAPAGAEVTISAPEAEPGTEFNGWTSTSEGVTFEDASKATTKFTMPANDVTISASFQNIAYKITMPNGGTAYVNQQEVTEAEAGATVTVEAPQAEPGTEFNGWTSTPEVSFADADSSTTSFTMPASNVDIYASFQNIAYNITMLNGGTAYVDGKPATTAEAGTVVTIKAKSSVSTPARFNGWTTTTEGVEFADADSVETTFVMPISDVTITASFEGVTPYVPSHSTGTSTTTSSGTASSVDSASSKAKMWAVQNDDKSSITVGWEKVNGATKYSLYVRKNGKLEKVVDTKKTKVLIKNPANNVNLEYVLKYTIGGVESGENSAYTASIKVYYKPAVKASSKDGAVILKWNKVEGAEKYRVYKYTGGKLVKVADTEANAVRLKNVTTGKTYKYAVKAYVDGKWTKVTKSDIVSVKVK